jgi:hypothetical protein
MPTLLTALLILMVYNIPAEPVNISLLLVVLAEPWVVVQIMLFVPPVVVVISAMVAEIVLV